MAFEKDYNSEKLIELLPNLICDTLCIIADVELLHDGKKDYIRKKCRQRREGKSREKEGTRP